MLLFIYFFVVLILYLSEKFATCSSCTLKSSLSYLEIIL